MNLHQLIKYDIAPVANEISDWIYHEMIPTSLHLELISDLTHANNQMSLESIDMVKEKAVYIAGFLSHKHFQTNEIEDYDIFSSYFIDEISRGSLKVPTFNMVHLSYSLCRFVISYQNLIAVASNSFCRYYVL